MVMEAKPHRQRRRAGDPLRSWLLVAFAGVAASYSTPTVFRPARTLPAGAVEGALSLETVGLGASSLQGACPKCAPMQTSSPALSPSAALRVGLIERVDLGMAFSALGAKADLTLGLVEARTVDLSLGPTVSLGIDGASASLPVIADLNVSRPLSIIGFAGPIYRFGRWKAASNNEDDSEPEPLFSSVPGQLSAQGGIGLDVRLPASTSLRPFVALVGTPGASSGAYTYAGLAFAFGDQRDFPE